MDIKDIFEKTLNHYYKMIGWALTRHENEATDPYIMREILGENWFMNDCPCCMEYYKKEGSCDNCPLRNYINPYSGNCCTGLWEKMSMSSTWKEWIDKAINLVGFIKEREEEYLNRDNREETIQELINELDSYGRDWDAHDYGLPISEKADKEMNRIVENWLKKYNYIKEDKNET